MSLSACHRWSETPPKLVSSGSLAQAAEYNVQLGLAYLQAGELSRAKDKLLRAQQQAPRSPNVKSAMGYFLAHTGEQQRAAAYYLQAIALAPKAGATHNNYGTFLCQQKQWRKAESHFLRAAEDPHYLNTASIWENAGLCALQVPELNKASRYFHKAIHQDPKRAKSWLGLAQIQYQKQDYRKAKSYLDQYMQLNTPAAADALWLGVQLAHQLKDQTEALRYTLYLKNQYPYSTYYQNILKVNNRPTDTINFS